ncbi:MAG TPA: HAMP domain-containing sensor histidine kinase [Afifellaceae bacterium]|nr:HAMP domain-containing sensor histidine kinase [Afifellaceae bacterium]
MSVPESRDAKRPPEQASGIADSGAPGGAPPRRRLSFARGLSGKLLWLTILFVMLAEVLIFVPSIANFRNVWLEDKLDSAAIAAIAATAVQEEGLAPPLQRKMLDVLGLEAIAVKAEGQRILIAAGEMPHEVAATYDLAGLDPLASIVGAMATLFSRDRTVLVSGEPPAGAERLEIVLSERDLRQAMLIYSGNILVLSLVISIITAALVYLTLTYMIVRPIERLAGNMTDFSAAPDDAGRVILPSGRGDEIGVAEERLAAMQKALRETLQQRRHLADLGLAVSKINHDLRNILASAQLFSDRLSAVDDPLVKRLAPKVVSAIDRAIGYTRSVLSYGQAREEPPQRRLVALRRLADDVADVLGLSVHERISWENRLDADLAMDSDPDQLFRAVMNICRNGLEALETNEDPAVVRRLWLEGERQGSVVRLRICDSGPGIPAMARGNLFQPFHGSAKPGGTGLGLAIAAEIVRAHGGEIALLERPGAGAVFEIVIPDRPVDLEARRSVRQA